MSSLADMRNAQALATARNQQEFSADQEFFSVAGNIGIVDSGTKLLKKGPDGEALGLQMLFEKTGEGKDAKYVHGDIAVNALNEVGLVKLFKDVKGDTIKEGKVSGINDNGDGSFSIMIDTPQGFFPKTFGFSNDPNDKVIKMDKAQVEKFVNLGFATKRGKAFKNSNYGDEYARIIESGVLANLEADFKAGEISNTELGQASQQLIEGLMNATPQSELDATNNTPIDTSTPKGAVNTQSDGSELPGARQLAMEDGQFGAPKPEFSYLEKNEVDTVFGLSEDDKKQKWFESLDSSKSNYRYYEFQKMVHQRLISKKIEEDQGTGKPKPDYQMYKETLREIKETIIEQAGVDGKHPLVDELEKIVRRDMASQKAGKKQTIEERIQFAQDQMDQTVYKQNQESSADKEKAEAGDRARVKFLQQQLSGNRSLDEETRAAYQQEADDTLARLDNRTPASEILPTAEELQISDVPATVKEQAAWYQENKGKIEQLGETKANEVKQILEQNNVNSVVDLSGLGRRIGQEKAKMVAAAMSFTMSGAPGESEETNMNNYIKLHNQIMTGDPSVNTNQAQTTANATATNRAAFQTRLDGYETAMQTQVQKFNDLLYPKEAKSSTGLVGKRDRIDVSLYGNSGNSEALRGQLRTELMNLHQKAKIQVTGNRVFIPPEKIDAVKNVYGQILKRSLLDSGSTGFFDGLQDIFRGKDPTNLAPLLDQVRVRVNPSKPNVEEIYFVNAAGKETEGSMEQSELISLFGTKGSKERAIFLSLISQD
jgi:hypothetical protein|tara:strand:+ start:1919 stop:4228 length:2310 start_codon:yes stop_codon:yes gene_type:complete